MNRREFLAGGAAAVTPSQSALADGQTIVIDGREHVLTDVVAPSTSSLAGGAEPAADFALAVLETALRRGSPTVATKTATDRWGRVVGAVGWRTAGRETTLQEIMLAQGAARVSPQSDDFAFIERCFAAERHARAARLGLWSHRAYRIRDASKGEWSHGFQIYRGAVAAAVERGNRIYFNFGADYRADFTATAPGAAFRRWKSPIDIATAPGRFAEVRGFVEAINGPSIELRHEMQLRFV